MPSSTPSQEPAHIQHARQQFTHAMAAQPELLAAGMHALDLASAAFADPEQLQRKLEASRRRVAELEQIVASTKHIRNGRKNRNYKWRQQLRKLSSMLTSLTVSEKQVTFAAEFWAAANALEETRPLAVLAGIRRLYVCVNNDNYTTDATATLSVSALVQDCK